jgi:hypothetical protein
MPQPSGTQNLSFVEYLRAKVRKTEEPVHFADGWAESG